MSDGTTTWTNTYNADGLRTKRTNGTTTYSYVYTGSTLLSMTVSGNTLYFNYDAAGTPLTVTYNNIVYYYATNLQGDVVAILDSTGTTVVSYTYDAWGNPLTTTGSLATTLGQHNPLRYRGYVYDTETHLYYLQSRYYNAEVGRFINADGYTSTGQGFSGKNVFVYCANQPVIYYDSSGTAYRLVGAGLQLELDVGCGTVGVEIIVYWDEKVCGDNDLLVCVYTYGGGVINLNDPNLGSVISTIMNNADSIKLLGESFFKSLASSVAASSSVSASGVAVLGNESFNSARSYEKEFRSFGGSIGLVKGGVACSNTTLSISFGAVASTSSASVVGGASTYYTLRATIPISFSNNKTTTKSSSMQYTKKYRGLVV